MLYAEKFTLVSQVRVQIDSVRALDPVLAALLADRGVTEEYLTALESQLAVTDQSIDDRQDAIQTEQQAVVAMDLAFTAAYDQVSALRQVSRTVLAAKDGGMHTQIFLDDALPRRYRRRKSVTAQYAICAGLCARCTCRCARCCAAIRNSVGPSASNPQHRAPDGGSVHPALLSTTE